MTFEWHKYKRWPVLYQSWDYNLHYCGKDAGPTNFTGLCCPDGKVTKMKTCFSFFVQILIYIDV